MKEYKIIGVNQFGEWENQINRLQSEGDFEGAKNLYFKIVGLVDAQELKRDNETEWLENILAENTWGLILSE